MLFEGSADYLLQTFTGVLRIIRYEKQGAAVGFLVGKVQEFVEECIYIVIVPEQLLYSLLALWSEYHAVAEVLVNKSGIRKTPQHFADAGA